MKRKLDNDNVPTEVLPGRLDDGSAEFSTFGLDPRLLQAVVKQKWSKPTLVQSKAIPLALEGKDILGEVLHQVQWPSLLNATNVLQPVPKLDLGRLGRMCSQYFSLYLDGKL